MLTPNCNALLASRRFVSSITDFALHTYSSNKRACSNRFVNVSVVRNNNGQKLKEKVKREKRKLIKHLKEKNNLKIKKKQHTQNKNTFMLKT